MDDLASILRRAPLLMQALEAARDVDLGFFDPDDLSPQRDAEVEAALRDKGFACQALAPLAPALWWAPPVGECIRRRYA
jgi:hypothetical protein